MIRINLLPFRAERKKENIKRQISIYVLTLVLLLIGSGYLFLSLSRTLSALEADKSAKEKELASYAKTNQEIEKLKKTISEIKKKLDVIQTLEKNKKGPIQLLEEVAKAVPKERLWLDEMNERGGILSLSGTAMDNDTVAMFMTNLENSEHISNVDLKSTKLKYLRDYKLNVTDFVLTCKTYSFIEKKPEPVKKGRRR